MSILDLIVQTMPVLNMDHPASIFVVDAAELSNLHVPPFSPEAHALIIGINSNTQLLPIQTLLAAVYPEDHAVKLVQKEGAKDIAVQESRLDHIDATGAVTAILIPPLPKGAAFEQFQEIVAHLRAPDGCPWDREQTHMSLRKHLIEESYEAQDAIDSGNPDKMREEFGDLLLQIVLHAQIASEAGDFTMTGVIRGIHDKIVRRHPHVFGDVAVAGVENVLQNWERIKAEEREANGDAGKGLLDGLPASLPALVQAQEIQNRAARVGFDWPEIQGVMEKIQEEIEEVRDSTNPDELAGELGDLIFALVNLARWKGIDAESSLRETNRKFKSRFGFIESQVKKTGKQLPELSLDEMELLWQTAKENELNQKK